MTWKTFFFESNRFFDYIKSIEDWNRLRATFSDMSIDQLLGAKEATYRGTRSMKSRESKPNYGFRIEHDGDKTLRDFMHENNTLHLVMQNETKNAE